MHVLAPANLTAAGDCSLDSDMLNPHSMVGSVPPGIPQPSVHALVYNSEDDEAVLRMIIKGRPHLRHVSRTHRINSDWLHERSIGTPRSPFVQSVFGVHKSPQCRAQGRNATLRGLTPQWQILGELTGSQKDGASSWQQTSCPG